MCSNLAFFRIRFMVAKAASKSARSGYVGDGEEGVVVVIVVCVAVGGGEREEAWLSGGNVMGGRREVGSRHELGRWYEMGGNETACSWSDRGLLGRRGGEAYCIGGILLA